MPLALNGQDLIQGTVPPDALLLRLKDGVRVATTAALPANTMSSDGLTLTADVNGAFDPIDDVTLLVGDDVLVKDEGGASPAPDPKNGLYRLTTAGDEDHPWVLTRREDANSSGGWQNGGVVSDGMTTFSQEGTVNSLTEFVMACAAGPVTLGATTFGFGKMKGSGGATAPTFSQVNAALAVANAPVVVGPTAADPATPYPIRLPSWTGGLSGAALEITRDGVFLGPNERAAVRMGNVGGYGYVTLCSFESPQLGASIYPLRFFGNDLFVGGNDMPAGTVIFGDTYGADVVSDVRLVAKRGAAGVVRIRIGMQPYNPNSVEAMTFQIAAVTVGTVLQLAQIAAVPAGAALDAAGKIAARTNGQILGFVNGAVQAAHAFTPTDYDTIVGAVTAEPWRRYTSSFGGVTNPVTLPAAASCKPGDRIGFQSFATDSVSALKWTLTPTGADLIQSVNAAFEAEGTGLKAWELETDGATRWYVVAKFASP